MEVPSGPKPALRQSLKAVLRTARSEHGARSRELCSRLREMDFWHTARTVGLFAPLPDEPDVLPLMVDDKKRFVFPRILENGLAWHLVDDISSLRAESDKGYILYIYIIYH